MIIDGQKEAVIKVKNKMCKMPLFVMELWVRRAIEAGNVGRLHDFANYPSAATDDGGFIWANTVEGRSFWSHVTGQCYSYVSQALSELEYETSKYLDFQHIH